VTDIFLSYAREDWERIRPLAQSLEALGWSVWWDTRMRAGLHFDEMIEAEIAEARCVIVVWTKDSVKSHWVRAEAAEALDQHKLIPVLFDAVKVPLLFRHVQGLDIRGWNGSADDPALRRLIEDASQLAGPPTQPVLGPARPRPEVAKRPPPSESAQTPPRKARATDVSEPEMVRIEPGTFLLGSAEGEGYEDEHPQHQVRIARPFGMARYAVTFEEYDAFIKANKRKPAGDEGWGRGRRPAINLSWEDAVAYAQWLSEKTGKRYRLPTEAEWEYAARAGTTGAWSFGSDQGDIDKYAWSRINSGGQTRPVGEKEPNPWGLYDVHGNVWEWVQDCWHESYEGAPADRSAWEAGGGGDCGRRVVRGGSWANDPVNLRSAARNCNETAIRYFFLGFRLAQDL
jgi:formylglycine-generating enzyme required for sulfatase activity